MSPDSQNDHPSVAAERPRRWLYLPSSRGRRVAFVAVYLLFCAGLVWGATRLYWNVHAGVPLMDTATIWDVHYPELREAGLVTATPRHADGQFDVLVLDGSALDPSWGQVAKVLAERLEGAGLAPWSGAASLNGSAPTYRIYNLARSAHTSRDSRLKYEHLVGKEFDLVLLYDGINDVRMNNITTEHFRDDYSHCSWYRSFQKQLAAGSMSLPVVLSQQLATVSESIGLGSPDEALVDYGSELKTPGPFRQNQEQIAKWAAERGDPLALMTYVYYVPANYSLERFNANELDYARYTGVRCCPIEMWGHAENVVAAIDAQNEKVRELAADFPDVGFIDQQRLLPAQGENFVDPCHLTPAGSEKFVDNLWPTVAERLAKWRAGRK